MVSEDVTCVTLQSMINGVIIHQLQTLDEVLLELRSLAQVTEAQLHDDWRTRRVIAQGLTDFAL